MFRVWVKLFKHNKIYMDTVISDTREDINRTRLITDALAEACKKFDLAVPTWLDNNIEEFQKYSKTRFYQDNFIEVINFDFLEFHVLEEMNGIKHK